MVAQPESDQVTHPLYVLKQSAKVGCIGAVPGFGIGALAGTIRTSTPVLFALVSSTQWFAIGTTFWAIRSSILDDAGLKNWLRVTRGLPIIPRPELPPSSGDKVKASAISGAITGAILGAAFRGPRNVIPGTVMFTLFGYGGQHAYEYFDNRHTRKMEKLERMKQAGEKELNWLERVAKSKWSPMSVLTDDQYEELLKEKILAVDVDIALIDDRIAEQKQKQKQKELEKAGVQKDTQPPEKK